MATNKSMLGRNHLVDTLIYAVDHDGFIQSDLNDPISGNNTVVGDLCDFLETTDLFEPVLVRTKRKTLTHFYLTEVGWAVGRLVKLADGINRGTISIEDGAVREFLISQYGPDALTVGIPDGAIFLKKQTNAKRA